MTTDKKPIVPFSLKDAPALIERLLPVRKLSAEAYKEQMAVHGKTLTALGTYWKGRKPLILAKACILAWTHWHHLFNPRQLLVAALVRQRSDAGGKILLCRALNRSAKLSGCPSTLTAQWQVELSDKLGIPSAAWLSTKKAWIDPKGHIIKTRGPEDVARCPFRIAIVSTGLIFHDSEERRHLLERRYGTVVLDEAHRARRRGGLGQKKEEPNNLLGFMLQIGSRTRNLLLGTATPIQTEVHEVWDLMRILNAGSDVVLGREFFGFWSDWPKALPMVKGEETHEDEREAF